MINKPGPAPLKFHKYANDTIFKLLPIFKFRKISLRDTPKTRKPLFHQLETQKSIV